jgi:hypothetical protein
MSQESDWVTWGLETSLQSDYFSIRRGAGLLRGTSPRHETLGGHGHASSHSIVAPWWGGLKARMVEDLCWKNWQKPLVDGWWIFIISYSSKKKMQKRQTYNFLAWNLPVFRQNNLITNAQINIKLLTYISCWELKAAWPYYESTYKKKCCAVTNLHCTRAWFHLGAECSKECALAITSTMPQPSCCVFHQTYTPPSWLWALRCHTV